MKPISSSSFRTLFLSFAFAALSSTQAAPDFAKAINANAAIFAPINWKSDGAKSLVFEKPLVANGEVASSWRDRPVFSKSNEGKSVARLAISEETSLYGEGEVTGRLLRNGTEVVDWNTDNYGYFTHFGGKSLYQSNPWVLAVRKDGSAFGVYADTTWRTKIDLKSDISFTSDGPPFRVVVIEGKTPQEVLTRMSSLTGRMPLPPLWALGYQQCRYSYMSADEVRHIAQEFRTRKIPCDVIWMDIDYMNGYRIFTFNPKTFPNPHALSDVLHSEGFHGVWMIDPGVKVDQNYAVYRSGEANDVFVKTANGEEYHGKVWPGDCAFPDFTQPKVRSWWAGLYKLFVAQGVDGVWNDMNEPSVFGGVNQTMPIANRHLGGGGLLAGPHAEYHNVYGRLMVEATREGLMRAAPQKRPFVLSRSNFFGGHRYAAMWTGDNLSTWKYLQMSIPMSLNVGLALQPFTGPDIGGFGGKATPELWARWIGIGAFYPFCRAHASKGTPRKEPWAFGPVVEKEARIALERRYRLLPYFYSLFYEATQDGLPVMRPVFFADPKDASLRSEDSAFLVGSDLLVVPDLLEKGNQTHALPKGIWNNLILVGEDPAKDIDQPVLRVRGGAIIPAGPVMQFTGEKPLNPLTFIVSLDAKGEASGSLYEDAGNGYGYQKGDYKLTTFAAKRNGENLDISVVAEKGTRILLSRNLDVILVSPNGQKQSRVVPAKFPLTIPLAEFARTDWN